MTVYDLVKPSPLLTLQRSSNSTLTGNLGRPLVDRIEDSKIHNLMELRPGSSGAKEVRILFVFDRARQAVLLVAGDKPGQWNRRYDENIPVAEQRYERWLDEGHSTERTA